MIDEDFVYINYNITFAVQYSIISEQQQILGTLSTLSLSLFLIISTNNKNNNNNVSNISIYVSDSLSIVTTYHLHMKKYFMQIEFDEKYSW